MACLIVASFDAQTHYLGTSRDEKRAKRMLANIRRDTFGVLHVMMKFDFDTLDHAKDVASRATKLLRKYKASEFSSRWFRTDLDTMQYIILQAKAMEENHGR